MSDIKKVFTEDGQDITEGVQILYDIAHSSMDWGSGFLDNEEMSTVIRLAVLMGWKVPDLPYSTSDKSPIVSVATEFPDHYDIKVIKHPPTAHNPNGWESYSVSVKADPPKH